MTSSTSSILGAWPFLLAVIFAIAPVQAGPDDARRFHDYNSTGNEYPGQNQVQSDYWREWAVMRTSTDSLLKAVGATNSEAGQLLQQVQTNAQFLDARWNKWFAAHVRSGDYLPNDAYLASLRGDNWQLHGLKKEKDGAKVLAALRDVALDLQIKADNCRHSADGLGKEISVKVHTKADGREVGGYEVYFVSKGMFGVKGAYDRFPRQSSPTDEKILCPGGYAMWVRKKDFTGEPVFIGLGGHGETRLEVDLEVSPQ